MRPTMRGTSLLVLLAMGCGTDELGLEPVTIAFASPAPGSSHMRTTLGETGALVANVPVALEVGGEVARITLRAGERELGEVTEDRYAAANAQVGASGLATLSAVAFDDAGGELATASVEVNIIDPEVADCQGWLDLYQLDYMVGPSNPGIENPITVKTPINGVNYRYNGNTEQRKTLYGDCALMKSLAEGAPIMREAGIVEFVDIGVYNYRCIDQSKTPPNCTLSQHAYAKAIDIAGFMTGDGTKYSVLTDWVIDADDNTCGGDTEGGKDTFLHDVICKLKAADVWNIVLTPNYNSAHRNHFHVDLTAGSDFIERTLAGMREHDPSISDALRDE